MIKNKKQQYPDNKLELFIKYLDTLFTSVNQKLTGEKAVIRRMLSYWEYFSTMFPNPTKVGKNKKSQNLQGL